MTEGKHKKIWNWMLGIGVIAVVALLVLRLFPLPHETQSATRMSVWQSAKSQIDVCNIKNATVESDGTIILDLKRKAPDVDVNGKQIAVTDRMSLAADNKKRVLEEIDQLKPSCEKPVPLLIKNPFNSGN